MAPHALTRGQLPVKRDGLGINFSSPLRPRDKKKTATRVVFPDRKAKRQKLLDKLTALEAAVGIPSPPPTPSHSLPHTPLKFTPLSPQVSSPPVVTNSPVQSSLPNQSTEDNDELPHKKPRRILPNAESFRLYNNWHRLVPTLVDPLLAYTNDTIGRGLPLFPSSIGDCHQNCIDGRLTKVTCLLLDCMYIYNCHVN